MPTRERALESLADAFRLDESDVGWTREISSFWTFGDRLVFGGYVGSLTLAAAAAATGMANVISCHIMFLGSTDPSPILLVVESLREGRVASGVRVTASQEGEVVVATQAWLSSHPHIGSSAKRAEWACSPSPDESEPITFRSQEIAFMGVLEERAVEYPVSSASFHSGPEQVDVWSRPALPLGDNGGLCSQLFDVMCLDAHVLDAALSARASTDVTTASVDLSVEWYDTSRDDGWRRVRTQSGAVDSEFVSTSGTVHSRSGRLRARGMQTGRVWRSPR